MVVIFEANLWEMVITNLDSADKPGQLLSHTFVNPGFTQAITSNSKESILAAMLSGTIDSNVIEVDSARLARCIDIHKKSVFTGLESNTEEIVYRLPDNSIITVHHMTSVVKYLYTRNIELEECNWITKKIRRLIPKHR